VRHLFHALHPRRASPVVPRPSSLVRNSSPAAHRQSQLGAALVAIIGLIAIAPNRANAHEIPSSVVIQAFVKAEGQRLHLLVRVPLESIRDVKFPLRGPGYLELGAVQPALNEAAKLWIADYVELYENGTKLPEGRIVATRASLQSDRAFESYDQAVASVTGAPLPPTTDLAWQQAMLDVLLEYPIASDRSRFSIDPALAHLGVRTTTVLRYVTPDGAVRAFQYHGDPGVVRLDPRWYQAAFQFVGLGFRHILDGIDHLLFVFCLVIPFRRIRPLIAIVTAFTVAHSITLIAAATGMTPKALWFPPLIEALIALSIVYMAFENIVGPKMERRWLVAFGFGLVHGFGFSFALRESMQFAGSHLLTSLLAFNVGVELGQLFVLALTIPALAFVFKYMVAERMGTILLSALVAHTAWHWLTARVSTLREYAFVWPRFDAALAASALRVAMLMLVIAGAGWLMFELYTRLGRGAPTRDPNLVPELGGGHE
jgi:hypothetical protein